MLRRNRPPGRREHLPRRDRTPYPLVDPWIADAAVVRKKDEKWGEVTVMFAARTDEALTGDELIGMCRGKIVSYKLPKEMHFVAMEALPRSTSEKIQRHVLEKRLG